MQNRSEHFRFFVAKFFKVAAIGLIIFTGFFWSASYFRYMACGTTLGEEVVTVRIAYGKARFEISRSQQVVVTYWRQGPITDRMDTPSPESIDPVGRQLIRDLLMTMPKRDSPK